MRRNGGVAFSSNAAWGEAVMGTGVWCRVSLISEDLSAFLLLSGVDSMQSGVTRLVSMDLRLWQRSQGILSAFCGQEELLSGAAKVI